MSDMDASDGHGTMDAKAEPAVKLMTVHAAKASALIPENNRLWRAPAVGELMVAVATRGGGEEQGCMVGGGLWWRPPFGPAPDPRHI